MWAVLRYFKNRKRRWYNMCELKNGGRRRSLPLSSTISCQTLIFHFSVDSESRKHPRPTTVCSLSKRLTTSVSSIHSIHIERNRTTKWVANFHPADQKMKIVKNRKRAKSSEAVEIKDLPRRGTSLQNLVRLGPGWSARGASAA